MDAPKASLQKQGAALNQLASAVTDLNNCLAAITQQATELSSSMTTTSGTSADKSNDTLETLMAYGLIDELKANLHMNKVAAFFRFGTLHPAPLVLKFLICLTSVIDDDVSLDWMQAALLDLNVNDPEVHVVVPVVLKKIIDLLETRKYDTTASKVKGNTIIHIARSLYISWDQPGQTQDSHPLLETFCDR